jgi:hypothetical protein
MNRELGPVDDNTAAPEDTIVLDRAESSDEDEEDYG